MSKYSEALELLKELRGQEQEMTILVRLLQILKPAPKPEPEKYVPLPVETIRVDEKKGKLIMGDSGNSYAAINGYDIPDAQNLVHMVKHGMRAIEHLRKDKLYFPRASFGEDRDKILDDLDAGPK